MPKAVKLTLLMIGILALTHLLVPAFMFAHSSDLAVRISHDHPDFSASQVEKSVALALRSALIFHAVLMIALIALAVAFAGRRRWSRRAITTLSAISLVSSIVSWRSSPMFHGVIVVSDLLLIALIITLWMHRDIDGFLKSGTS